MKNILVPVDFSIRSIEAIRVANSIAEKSNASLIILHVVEIPKTLLKSSISEDTLIKLFGDIKHDMEEKLSNLEISNNAISIKKIVKVGSFLEQLKNVSNDEGADLIVMGTNGIDTWQQAFFGSNTQKVIQTVDCPVLTIPSDKTNLDFNQMMFVSDYHENLINQVDIVKDFQEQYHATLDLVRINTLQDFETTHEVVKRMKNFAKHTNISYNHTIQYDANYLESGINNVAKDLDTNLIIMGTHGNTTWFSSNTAIDILDQSSVPMLLFKIK